VVVPTLLTDAAYIEELVEALEIRYLANPEAYLHYGLLTDFPDAAAQTLPEDEGLLELASQRIEALNEKYSTLKRTGSFFFTGREPGMAGKGNGWAMSGKGGSWLR
jgi:cyclic beta-1,2-glucan synthetase